MESQKFAGMEVNQHSGKTSVTHSHAIMSFSLVMNVPIRSVRILMRQPYYEVLDLDLDLQASMYLGEI
jgi:hypothetical protein